MEYIEREASLDPDEEEEYNEELEAVEPKKAARVNNDFDSSEEESEDDDEEAARIREGFIVEDDEDDDEELEDGTMVKVKRRRKRRRSHRGEEEDEVLDEEDLDLMLENTGGEGSQENKSKFKRLKRGREERNGQASRALVDIFSDEELDAPGDLDDDERDYGSNRRADEFDGFIENDSSDDEERRMGSGDERIARRRSGRGRRVDADLLGLRDGAMNDMDEIFGLGDYEEALVLGDGMAEMEERTHELQLKDVFEPSELEERLLTDEDNAIRHRDEPERFQIARKPFRDLELTPEQLAEEARWIANALITKKDVADDLEEPFSEAVRRVLRFFIIDNYEVPFVYHQRRDYLIHVTKMHRRTYVEGEPIYDLQTERMLYEKDLWLILDMDIKFRALVVRRNNLEKLYRSLRTHMKIEPDRMLEERIPAADQMESIQDLFDYIHFQYQSEVKDLAFVGESATARRRPTVGKSVFERIRTGRVYGLVKAFGITPTQFATNVRSGKKREFAEDPNEFPLEMADNFVDSDFPTSTMAMDAAKTMLVEEIYMNPVVREVVRKEWFTDAVIFIDATEKGVRLIDERHQYYSFKYLRNQPIESLARSPEKFLMMLKAENDGFVEIRFALYNPSRLSGYLYDYIVSGGFSEIADAWNAERKEVVDRVMAKFSELFQAGLRDGLRTGCEEAVSESVTEAFTKRLDQAPYKPKNLELGELPRVFTFSNGKGDRGDAIVGVFLDEEGRAHTNIKVNNLKDEANRKLVHEILLEKRPDVIGVSGFSVQTNRLYEDLKKLVEEKDITVQDEHEDGRALCEVLFVNDEVARLYYSSRRAKVDHPEFPPLARYCCALARYVQGPLLEYAALGKDLVGISFHPAQNLLPPERLWKALETALVDIVNVTGVLINEAVRQPRIANLLPYVAGLGPRKASHILKLMSSCGGKIATREHFVLGDPDKLQPSILGPKVFENAASFFNIPYTKNERESEYLDGTRVHPEAYELGRKMAADALDFDEEDVAQIVQNAGKGGIINRLIKAGTERLNELILEEYAEELEKNFNQRKRATLEMIRAELQSPYEELRSRFLRLGVDEVFTMLTGETKESLEEKMVVAVKIRRVTNRYLSARLDCGIEGNIILEEMPQAAQTTRPTHLFSVGQTLQARIESLSRKTFFCELSLKEEKIRQPIRHMVYVPQGDWDDAKEEKDKARLAVTNQEQARTARVIKHPLFKAFNSRQAEEFLVGRGRGDAVIRPSSNGPDHIAVTWKVGENIYQHIDVLELDKVNEFAIGKILRVQGRYSYGDLDDLIVNHVKAMARKIDDLCNNSKFQSGSRTDAEQWLEKYCEANPKRSSYAFCLDEKKPGYFLLLFKAGLNSPLGCWPVRVIPGAYQLRGTSYPDVITLCNGFKTMFTHLAVRPGRPGGGLYSGISSGYNGSGYNGSGYNGSGYNSSGYSGNGVGIMTRR